MDIQTILVSCLVFGAVLCFLYVIRTMMPTSTENENQNRLPTLFKIFGGGIFFFAAEAGSIMTGMFPQRSQKLQESLNKAALQLEVKDIYGAQIFFLLFGATIGFITMLSVNVSPLLQIAVALMFGLIGMLYPIMYIDKLAEQRVDQDNQDRK